MFEYGQEFNIPTRMIKSKSMMGDEGFFYRGFTFNQQAQLNFLKRPSFFFERHGSLFFWLLSLDREKFQEERETSSQNTDYAQSVQMCTDLEEREATWIKWYKE